MAGGAFAKMYVIPKLVCIPSKLVWIELVQASIRAHELSVMVVPTTDK